VELIEWEAHEMGHMSDHRGWRISITPWQDANGQWGARIEVWEPGKTPQTHGSVPIRFPRKAASESEVITLARQHAEKWVEDQR
jgi:hypothetical protein